MATLSREPNGTVVVQFRAADGKRKSIRLGKRPKREAEVARSHIEELIEATQTGRPLTDEVMRWLDHQSNEVIDCLSRVGLIAEPEVATIGSFLEDYFRTLSHLKASTATMYGHTRRNMETYFGLDCELHRITPGDADAFRAWLSSDDGEGLSDNTVRRRCGVAKMLGRAAVRRRLIRQNPFDDLVSAVRSNPERARFVSDDVARKVLDACPDAQWRLLFSLARYGGLRVPSEALALTWQDVDWAGQRIRVPSPKTEHHAGGASRVIPMFPELYKPLREVFEHAKPGTVHVITRYRKASVNLRTHLERIIKKAGVEQWPKLWQNLRATRATELADRFPGHVAASWCGHAEPVAMEHYWQVTDEHFQAAVVDETPDDACMESGAAHDGNEQQVVTEPAITALPERESRDQWAIQVSNL